MENNITDYFISLVKIDSESRNEREVAQKLEKELIGLGAKVVFDDADKKTNGNIGNLYAYFPGSVNKTPLLLCAHMDTVVPGKNIKPVIKDNRIITDGTTILGSDDKSGIAEIIWGIKSLKEKKIPHAPIEVLFTISEEIGLLGAKNVDYDLLKARSGFALDGHNVGNLVIGSPSQNSMKYIIHGKEAHAGVEPENGVSAIQIASEAISKMTLGRIDAQTTCNVGVIHGGKATNIIPKEVMIKAEARSHSEEMLNKVTEQISLAVINAASRYKLNGFEATVDVTINKEYESFRFDSESSPVKLGMKTSEILGLQTKAEIGGGGSDANIFNEHGLEIVIAGTGMSKVHTIDEFITIPDLITGADWVEKVLEIYSKS